MCERSLGLGLRRTAQEEGAHTAAAAEKLEATDGHEKEARLPVHVPEGWPSPEGESVGVPTIRQAECTMQQGATGGGACAQTPKERNRQVRYRNFPVAHRRPEG